MNSFIFNIIIITIIAIILAITDNILIKRNIKALLKDELSQIKHLRRKKQNKRYFGYVDEVADCVKKYRYMPPLPKRATAKSAGYDIFSPYDIILKPEEEIKVPTYIKAHMNDDEVLKIYPRSGLGFKYYTRLANSVGIIDADYVDSDNEGHIYVKIRNEGNKELHIKQGEALCQAIFQKYLLVIGDNFKTGKIRNGGFGSTDSSTISQNISNYS